MLLVPCAGGLCWDLFGSPLLFSWFGPGRGVGACGRVCCRCFFMLMDLLAWLGGCGGVFARERAGLFIVKSQHQHRSLEQSSVQAFCCLKTGGGILLAGGSKELLWLHFLSLSPSLCMLSLSPSLALSSSSVPVSASPLSVRLGCVAIFLSDILPSSQRLVI